MKPHHTHSSGTNPELCTSTKVQSVSRSIMSDSLWTPWAVAHQESCVGFVVFLDAILIRKPCSKVMFKGIQAAAGPGPPWNSPPPPPSWGFPGDTSGKEPTCQCRRLGGMDPWVGKIPGRRAWQPTPLFLPGASHGQRSLGGYSP